MTERSVVAVSECCWPADQRRVLYSPARVHARGPSRWPAGAPDSPPRRPGNPAVPFNAPFGHLQLLPGSDSQHAVVSVGGGPSRSAPPPSHPTTAVRVRDARLYDGGPNGDFDSSWQVGINGVIIAAGVVVLSLGTERIASGSKLNSRLFTTRIVVVCS